MDITENEAIESIRSGDTRLGPLEMLVPEQQRRRATDGATTPGIDLRLALSWDGQRHDFFLQYRSRLTPRQLDALLPQLERVRRQAPDLLPIVVAPYLSNKVIERLVEQRISGFDLSGNYAIIVPNAWFILHTGEPNKFPFSQPIREIYQRTSSLVSRALLVKTEYPRAVDLQNEIQRRGGEITKGTISKVLQALEEEVIIRRSPTILLIQPEELLDRLTADYVPPSRREVIRAKAPQGFLEQLAKEAARLGVKVIGRDESLYAVAPKDSNITTVYSTDPERLISSLPFDRESRFPNIELIRVQDPSVYFDATERNGFPWCSRLQIYLELANGGKREQDTAAAIRPDITTRIQYHD